MNDLKELKVLTKDLTALCVEDSKVILKQLSIFLEKLFKEVYIADDGLDGIEKYKIHKPNIIFTDLTMPNMNGFEMIDVLKKINPSVKIIIISAHADIPNILEAVKFGIFDFVAKPVDKELLQKAIYNLIDRNEEKTIDTNYIKILKILYNYKIALEFTNHYKGVPIVNEGYIIDFNEHTMLVDIPSIQRLAIRYEKQTLIETNVLDTIIEAKFKEIDKDTQYVSLVQFKEFKFSSKQREHVRVDVDDNFKIVLHYKGNKLDTLVKNISLKSVLLQIRKSNFDLQDGDLIDLALGFQTHVRNSRGTIDHNELIPAKGKIFKVTQKELHDEIVILFEISTLDKNILKKYIYERELELISEFKSIK